MEQKLMLEHHTQGMLARMSPKQCEQWLPRLAGSRKAATGSSYRRVVPAFISHVRVLGKTSHSDYKIEFPTLDRKSNSKNIL